MALLEQEKILRFKKNKIQKEKIGITKKRIFKEVGLANRKVTEY